MFEENDLVIVLNDPNKIVYKISKIKDNFVELVGYRNRTKLKIDIDFLQKAPKDLIEACHFIDKKYKKALNRTRNKTKKYLFGRILHIDGDQDYLNSCLELYEEAGVHVVGIYMDEKELPNYIETIINKITPDIVVITGHDIYNGKDIKNISNYENSETFGKSIRIIRKSFSDTVIIAGACGSHFEYLIAQGANFASSPARINIHTFDPAVAAIKVASTPINKMVDYINMIKYIENGKEAIGGVETYGKMKIIYWGIYEIKISS